MHSNERYFHIYSHLDPVDLVPLHFVEHFFFVIREKMEIEVSGGEKKILHFRCTFVGHLF